MRPPRNLEEGTEFASRTTLEVGGPARFLVPCGNAEELREALAWGREQDLEIFLLGGGSNLLVSDRGFDGLVLQIQDRRLDIRREGEDALVEAGAGLPWDELVATTVEEGLAGVEALSGIPGSAGAAPIQNIGAYGQELSETLESVGVVELATGNRQSLSAAACGLGYRSSAFKGTWKGRFAITSLTLRLRPGGPGAVRYRDLAERFGPSAEAAAPSPGEVRTTVLEIRRSKSMVLDPRDPNRRSAGSFFLNPILSRSTVEKVVRRIAELRGREAAERMPRFPTGDGRIKLSAAWLMEAAGFHRGLRQGAAGLSTRHVLALINLGGASAAELLDLAAGIRRRVREALGVTLRPEPTFLGFDGPPEEILDRS